MKRMWKRVLWERILLSCSYCLAILLLSGCPGGGGGGGESDKSSVVSSSSSNSTFGTNNSTQSSPEKTQSPPLIHNLSPCSGSIAGGTSVSIKGWFFEDVTEVTFGGEKANNITLDNSNSSEFTISCLAPSWPGNTGPVDIVVKTSWGSCTEKDGFYYSAGSGPSAIQDFVIKKDSAHVTLSWKLTNPGDEIAIYRGRDIFASLQGNAETYEYDEDSYGIFRLSVVLFDENGNRLDLASGLVDMGKLVWDPVETAEGYFVYVYNRSDTAPQRQQFSMDVFTSTTVSLKVLHDVLQDQGLLMNGGSYTFAVSAYRGYLISDLSIPVSCDEYLIKNEFP